MVEMEYLEGIVRSAGERMCLYLYLDAIHHLTARTLSDELSYHPVWHFLTLQLSGYVIKMEVEVLELQLPS